MNQVTTNSMPDVVPITIFTNPYFKRLIWGVKSIDGRSRGENYQHRIRYAYLLIMSTRMTVDDMIDMRRHRDWDTYDRLDDYEQVEVQFWEMYRYLCRTQGEDRARINKHLLMATWSLMMANR